MESLPNELFILIFTFIPEKDLLNKVSLVSKRWRANSLRSEVWEEVGSRKVQDLFYRIIWAGENDHPEVLDGLIKYYNKQHFKKYHSLSTVLMKPDLRLKLVLILWIPIGILSFGEHATAVTSKQSNYSWNGVHPPNHPISHPLFGSPHLTDMQM
jgi:hypothetical protein